ncbi:MAG: DUF2333 family protein [Pseudohongiellaceae bacterium]
MVFDKLKGRLPTLGRSGLSLVVIVLAILAIVILVLGMYWSMEPGEFNLSANTQDKLAVTSSDYVVGSATIAALIRVGETLLDKPGGYISNDVMPPGLYLDNMPNWEFGALVQVRDLARAFREYFSRSQSQSRENPDLIVAEPNFHMDSERWIFPRPESEYREATERLYSYLEDIADQDTGDAQFYARADNLSAWLFNVSSRLGSLSQRLSASVGQSRIDTNLVGETSATSSTPVSSESRVQTSWFQIDDVFYQARGATWALLHFLHAVEQDFADVLADKNATASLRQIIRELEASQRPVRFPIILNGSGFGLFANHSLTMANYVSRANAAIIDLRTLLSQG